MIITFVIPTYNRAAILAQCLMALEAEQTVDIPFEIVVVDDGSTDDTINELRRLQGILSVPFRVIRQENSGPATARNRGVEEARGHLIIFLGDDIIVEPGYVTQMYHAYKAYDCDQICVLGFTQYTPGSIPTPFGRWLDTRSDLQFNYQAAPVDGLIPFSLFYSSNLLVPRKELIDIGGFDQRFRYAAWEDTDLGYRLANAGIPTYYCTTAQALHVHTVSVRAITRRMQMVARASIDLRHINPELFELIYPDAAKRLGKVGAVRRLYRWILAEPIVTMITLIDERLGLALPHALYSRAMNAVHRREITRRWHSTSKHA